MNENEYSLLRLFFPEKTLMFCVFEFSINIYLTRAVPRDISNNYLFQLNQQRIMETGSGSGRIMFLTETEEELETSSANMTGTETGLYNDEESEKRFTETVTDGIGTFLNQTGVFTNTNSSNPSHIAVTDDFQVKVSTLALKEYSVELETKIAEDYTKFYKHGEVQFLEDLKKKNVMILAKNYNFQFFKNPHFWLF